MKRNYLLATISLLAAALLVGGCSQEETTVTDGTTLPEGMYPLTFTAVQTGDGLATRVEDETGGMSSQWSEGDKIEVIVSKDGKEETTTCTLTADGAVNQYDPQLYWQTKEDYTINAWYSNITEQKTIDKAANLADQSNGLAYVLKVENGVPANYNNKSITLPFKHQLAKVRVKLEGDGVSKVNTVQVKGYTSCTVEKGVVKNSGDIDYISMYQNDGYWEANLVPMTNIDATDFIKLNGNVQAKVTNVSELKAGNVYEIIINVEQASLKPGEDGKFTVNGGDVFIKDYEGSAPIVVNGNATITLDNVKLKTDGTAMEINNGATVTLNIEGTDNVFTSTGGAGIKIMDTTNSDQRGSITINGTSAGNSKLKVTAASGAAVGFRMAGDHWVTKYCGNIEINNITLETVGGNRSPAIGISAIESDGWDAQKTYGKISINGSTVTASSTGGAACIGTPYHDSSSPFTLEGISISNSTITTTAERNQAACIGFGYTAHVGKKIIGKIEFVNTTLSLTTGASNKVGFGEGNDSRELTEGIWNNGSKVGDTGWNPQ